MARRAYARLSLNGSIVQIVSPIHSSLYCSVCSNVLNNPQQSPCGCRFCLECITQYLSLGDKICPGETDECDIININLVRADYSAKRDVNKMVAKCSSKRCQVEYAVSEMEEHLKDCKADALIRNDTKVIVDYKSRESCLSCKYCGIILSKTLMETVHCNFDHVDICKEYHDYCPNDCGEVNKVLWKDHARTCDVNKLSCPYEKLGCDTKLRKTQMNSHLMEDAYKHTEVLLKHIDNLNNEITSLKLEKKMLGDVTSVTYETNLSTSNNIMKDSKEMKCEMTMMKNRAEVSNEIEPIKSLLNTLICNGSSLNEGLKSDVENIKSQLKFYNGNFLWQLTEYEENNNRRKYSEGFYTKDEGYRIQLELNRCDEKGYLSIYAKLMRGDFDDDLDWPFNKLVTIRILDQDRRNRNYVHKIDFDDAPNNCCGKPRKRYSERYGTSRFISLNELDNKPYLYSNCEIWIDCFVD